MLKGHIQSREVMALDTETLEGYCKLLADSSGRYLFIERKTSDTLPAILDFMLAHRFRASHNVFYNLNYDINAIIKFLPVDKIREIALYNKTEYEGLDLLYIPKKVFRIQEKDQNRSISFYDIAQFYGGSLEANGKKYLGMVKNEEGLDRKQIGESSAYWQEHEPEIIRYCVQDCKITKGLGELCRDTIQRATGHYPKGFVSKASITKDILRRSLKLPDITKIPYNALRFAYDSYHGGRFEIVQKGNIGQASLFDIVSAYPYHISNLIGLDNGTWHRVTDLSERACYGFYLVKVWVKYANLSPLSYKLRNGVMVYPILEGKLAYMTKHELEAYKDSISYEVITGWEYRTDRETYPLKDYIHTLFQCKSQTPKTSFEYDLYKILMNSIYGAFLEKVYKPEEDIWLSGKLFNPVWATMITALTRIDLWRYAQQDLSNVIGFATDSILFKGRPDLPVSKTLGAWDFEDSGPAIVVKSGIYQINSKYKSRGLQKGMKVKTPGGEQYADLFDYIRQKPDRTIYPVILERPVSYREAMAHAKTMSFEDINIFTKFQYDIDINKDYKRLWQEPFGSGSELFERSGSSSPLII
jgi:hypothetical protein